MKRKAFTLIELFTGIIIILILAGVSTLSFNIGRQTPKREAEKILSRIDNMMLNSNRRHKNFTISIYDRKITFVWDNPTNTYLKKETDKTYNVSSGLRLNANSNGDIDYEYLNNTFKQNFTLTVLNEDASERYYIIFYEGRVRISDTPPSSWTEENDI